MNEKPKLFCSNKEPSSYFFRYKKEIIKNSLIIINIGHIKNIVSCNYNRCFPLNDFVFGALWKLEFIQKGKMWNLGACMLSVNLKKFHFGLTLLGSSSFPRFRNLAQVWRDNQSIRTIKIFPKNYNNIAHKRTPLRHTTQAATTTKGRNIPIYTYLHYFFSAIAFLALEFFSRFFPSPKLTTQPAKTQQQTVYLLNIYFFFEWITEKHIFIQQNWKKKRKNNNKNE